MTADRQPDRHLAWDGCYNARDLGGLRRRDGGETRWGAMIRMDSPERLTDQAWAAMWDYGVRTMVDLRNDHEIRPDARPDKLSTLHVPLDEEKDPNFVLLRDLDGTPLFYQPFLETFPHKVASVLRAIANAEPGGIVFHCAAGRDRTGLISLILLSLADVEPHEIATDYALSGDRLRPAWVDLGFEDQTVLIETFLTKRGTTVYQAALDAVTSFDAESYLLAAGLTGAELSAVRNRLA